MLEAALFPGWVGTDFFSTFVLHFGSGPNPVSEPERTTVPVPPKQKVAVPASVRQHC
jgi:hypothetical protein